MKFRARRVVVVACVAAVLLGALTTTADAQNVARGILFKLGEKLTTELMPAGDVDTFVFYGVTGAKVSITLSARSGDISPTMTMTDANGNVLDLSAYTKVKGTKTKVSAFPLPQTGPYFLRVTDPLGRTGQYRLKTKGDLTRVPKVPTVTLGPGETFDVTFGAGPGYIVDTRIKFADRRKTVSVLHVYDPDGEEVPHGAGSFYRTSKGLIAALRMQSPARSAWRDDSDVRRLGEYGLRIGGASSPTTFTVKLKVRHEGGGGKRVVASTVPEVTRCHPEFGRPGSRVIIHGANFLPGKLDVLFGDTYARETRFLTPSTIYLRAPFGEGVVDVTVINSDGQEGVLEDAYTFISNPPNIGTVTPEEGPDGGGTVVNVYGERMTYVEKVTLGTTDFADPPEIVEDFHLRFTTEAMAPGIYDLTLTDKFGQKVVLPTAFGAVAAPVLVSLSPSEGGGGRPNKCIGQNFRPDHTVLVDGVPTATTYYGPTQLRWVTPARAVGDKITVGVRDIWGRTSTIPDAFEYVVSVGEIEELFSNNKMEDTGFESSDGGLAKWNPSANPGKLVATFGSDEISVPDPHSKSVSSNVFPLNTTSMYVVKWYNSKDCGSGGTLTGFSFVTGTSTSPSAVFGTFTVKIGHNKSSTGLTTSSPRTANFNGTPVTVISGVSYTLPKSLSTVTPVAYPTFSKTFNYNGTDHIVVDTSQAGGTRSQSWGVYSGYGKETHRVWGYPNTGTTSSGSTAGYYYQCALNFRSETSMAQSLFYRTESDFTEFEEPVVLPTSQPSGTDVLIEYQGAKEALGLPDPVNRSIWTQFPQDLMDYRYMRFRVTFKANLVSEEGPAIDSILIPYLYFD